MFSPVCFLDFGFDFHCLSVGFALSEPYVANTLSFKVFASTSTFSGGLLFGYVVSALTAITFAFPIALSSRLSPWTAV